MTYLTKTLTPQPMQVQVAIDVERTIQRDSTIEVASGPSPPESDIGSPRKSDDTVALRDTKR